MANACANIDTIACVCARHYRSEDQSHQRHIRPSTQREHLSREKEHPLRSTFRASVHGVPERRAWRVQRERKAHRLLIGPREFPAIAKRAAQSEMSGSTTCSLFDDSL